MQGDCNQEWSNQVLIHSFTFNVLPKIIQGDCNQEWSYQVLIHSFTYNVLPIVKQGKTFTKLSYPLKYTWGRFHYAKVLAFFYWQGNTTFLATNIRQHVANLSVFVAHFGIFNAKFVFWNWNLKMPSFFGIMLWKFWL